MLRWLAEGRIFPCRSRFVVFYIPLVGAQLAWGGRQAAGGQLWPYPARDRTQLLSTSPKPAPRWARSTWRCCLQQVCCSLLLGGGSNAEGRARRPLLGKLLASPAPLLRPGPRTPCSCKVLPSCARSVGDAGGAERTAGDCRNWK